MFVRSPPSRHSLRKKGNTRKEAEMGSPRESPTVSATDVPPTVTREVVMAVIDKLALDNTEEIKRAVIELRLLSRWDMDNRVLIGEAGGIPLLVSLITSPDSKIQENAVTALLNLSLFPANRTALMNTKGILEAITEVLGAGQTLESKENCAALLSSLLIIEEHRDLIGKNLALLDALCDLLNTGRVQGKKDTLRAIFHLALWQDNRSRLAKGRILPVLRAMMASPGAGLVEDTMSVLAKLATCREGVEQLNDGRTISVIVDHVRHGSRLAKENATSLLLAMCQTGGPDVEAEVRKHQQAIVGILCTLRAVGSPRAKAKASALMNVLILSDSFSFSA